MKRLYFLLSVAALQIVVGSLLMLQAAQPIRLSQDVFVSAGDHYVFAFSVLGSGRVAGNLSERLGRSFQVYVLDASGYAAFLQGSNALPSLFQGNGTRILFDVGLPGSGDYFFVATSLPARQELRVRVDLIVFGLKPIDSIVALIVLAGGLALVAASLTLSVWAWRRGPPAAAVSPGAAPDPLPDPLPEPRNTAKDPADDKTRIY